MKQITYKKGYKYQTSKNYDDMIPIKGFNIDIYFIKLTNKGELLIRAGYAWDGPSGPTKDAKWNMRASLTHDVLSQLIRMNLIPRSFYHITNEIFKQDLNQDVNILYSNYFVRKIMFFRARYYFKGVETKLAEKIAVGRGERKEYTAP